MLPQLFLSPTPKTDAFFKEDGTPLLPFDELVHVFEQFADPGLSMRRDARVTMYLVCRHLQVYARAILGRERASLEETWRAMTVALRFPVNEKESYRDSIGRWCRASYDASIDEKIMTAWLNIMDAASTAESRNAAKGSLLWCVRVYQPLFFVRDLTVSNRPDLFMDIVALYNVTNSELIDMHNEYYPRIGFRGWDAPEDQRYADGWDEDDKNSQRQWNTKWGWWQQFQLIFRYAVEQSDATQYDCLDALMARYGHEHVINTVILEMRHGPYSSTGRARRSSLADMLGRLVSATNPETIRVDVVNQVIARIDASGNRFSNAGIRTKAYLASTILHLVDAVGSANMDPAGDKSWVYTSLAQLRMWQASRDSDDLPWPQTDFKHDIDQFTDDLLVYDDENDEDEDDDDEDEDDEDE